VASSAMTGHSVFGETMIFLTLSTKFIKSPHCIINPEKSGKNLSENYPGNFPKKLFKKTGIFLITR
jgi:hypothetical protein